MVPLKPTILSLCTFPNVLYVSITSSGIAMVVVVIVSIAVFLFLTYNIISLSVSVPIIWVNSPRFNVTPLTPLVASNKSPL